MTKNLLLAILLIASLNLNAQIQFSKIIGKDSKVYGTGYGGFLKFSHPISEASDLTLELGANVFSLKEDPAFGWALIPIKAGYRYTLNQSGTGFYVEPQVGYNVYGIDPNDTKFTGLILAAGAGYLFQPIGKIKFDLGLLFESAMHKGGPLNYLSLRLSHNFSFGRRESE